MSARGTVTGSLACAVALAVSTPCLAQTLARAPVGLENVGVQEHLETRIPTDIVFRDHEGQRVRLADVIEGDRPVLLNLVYHSCPSFCSLVLDGTVAALSRQAWTVGVEFDVLTISIDPRDTPQIAADVRRRALYRYGRPQAEEGWRFLVAETQVTEDEIIEAFGVYPSIEALTDAVGFRYQWVPRQRQYAHPGVIIMLTPDARIARYLYGLEFADNDVRLGLLEASEGRSISGVEQLILYCYQYDATAQGYTLVAWRIMRIGGVITMLFLFGFLGLMWWRERKRSVAASEEDEASRTPRKEIPAPPAGPLVRVDR